MNGTYHVLTVKSWLGMFDIGQIAGIVEYAFFWAGHLGSAISLGVWMWVKQVDLHVRVVNLPWLWSELAELVSLPGKQTE